MGRKKGYQRASSEMMQTSEYHFLNSGSGSSSGGHVPFFLKSLTSLNSQSHHVDQFDNSGKVIGASHSVLDNQGAGGGDSASPRHSESSIGSLYSSNAAKTASSINVSKRQVNKEFVKSLQNDDDDWDDKIDTEIQYPNIEDLKLKSGSNLSVVPAITSTSPAPEAPNNSNGLLANYRDIIDDPFRILATVNTDTHDKVQKFKDVISTESIDLVKLKKISWNGIPAELRPIVWQILLGYLPANRSRRNSTLKRKRQEYLDNVKQVFEMTKKDQIIWHQIEIDVPRTNPHIKLYQFASTQKSLEKILYLWAIRHPASGYVQGINDLCTPIYEVFLSLYLQNPEKVEQFNTNTLDQELTDTVEADTFWCLTKILDTIQDNYIHEQPGIIRQVNELTNLIKRIDQSLIDHFDEQGLNFLQFSFRWMNCLLMRELNIKLIIRMWDTYISEFPNGFNEFHVYVCAAFLMKFDDDLKEMEFQDIILYLQDLQKTKSWKADDVELMMSEAFIWQSLYKNASAHLK